MKTLRDVRLQVEHETGNVVPILHEIAHALRRLIDTGEPTVIDLMSMPLTPAEGERLEEILGAGEVRVELRALGPSVIQESVFAGVWLITHHNADDEVMTRLVEIARVPDILLAQDADVAAGLARLDERLEAPRRGDPFDENSAATVGDVQER